MLRVIVSLLALLAAAPPPARGPAVPPPATASPLRPLPFHYDLYTFRGEGGETDVVAAYAVPVKHLGREDVDEGVRYRFDVTLVVADTALTSLTRADDSVYVAVPDRLPGDHLLHTHVVVRAPPSSATVQRVVMTDAIVPGRGQLYTTPFIVPDYGGSELELSDIALGLPYPTGDGWTRGPITLALLPTSQFPSSSFEVYYEIYNLPDGNRYDTEIVIEHLADADGEPVTGRPAVSLRFFGESRETEGTVRELRRVDTSLDRGRYRLTLEITDEVTGERARRSRAFHVRGWGPGTTMVPAHSRRAAGTSR